VDGLKENPTMPLNLHTALSRPRSMVDDEVERVLVTSAKDPADLRDHTLLSMAFGTALRIHELVALNDGDVAHEDLRARRFVELKVFKGAKRIGGTQEIELPERVQLKVEAYLIYRRRCGEMLTADTPLFMSQKGGRLSVRQARRIFQKWQVEALLERRFTFHATRHTACTRLYDETLDIRAVQEFARHADIGTTQRYTHVSRERLSRAIQRLPC
jgi:integrase/recombinase XerC